MNEKKKGRAKKPCKQPRCTCPVEGDYHEDDCPAYQWNVDRFLERQRAAKGCP